MHSARPRSTLRRPTSDDNDDVDGDETHANSDSDSYCRATEHTALLMDAHIAESTSTTVRQLPSGGGGDAADGAAANRRPKRSARAAGEYGVSQQCWCAI